MYTLTFGQDSSEGPRNLGAAAIAHRRMQTESVCRRPLFRSLEVSDIRRGSIYTPPQDDLDYVVYATKLIDYQLLFCIGTAPSCSLSLSLSLPPRTHLSRDGCARGEAACAAIARSLRRRVSCRCPEQCGEGEVQSVEGARWVHAVRISHSYTAEARGNGRPYRSQQCRGKRRAFIGGIFADRSPNRGQNVLSPSFLTRRLPPQRSLPSVGTTHFFFKVATSRKYSTASELFDEKPPANAAEMPRGAAEDHQRHHEKRVFDLGCPSYGNPHMYVEDLERLRGSGEGVHSRHAASFRPWLPKLHPSLEEDLEHFGRSGDGVNLLLPTSCAIYALRSAGVRGRVDIVQFFLARATIKMTHVGFHGSHSISSRSLAGYLHTYDSRASRCRCRRRQPPMPRWLLGPRLGCSTAGAYRYCAQGGHRARGGRESCWHSQGETALPHAANNVGNAERWCRVAVPQGDRCRCVVCRRVFHHCTLEPWRAKWLPHKLSSLLVQPSASDAIRTYLRSTGLFNGGM